MASFLDKILRSRKSPLTADDFRKMQSDAERDVERAQAAFVDEQNAWEASLLDADPAATKAARTRLIDAEDAHARAVARLGAIRQEFLRACEAEAEADRVARYEAIRDKVRAAEKALKRYAPLAQQIGDIARLVAEAEVEALAVNEDLPAGAAPLSLPENIRGWPARPGEVVEERIEDGGWHYAFESWGRVDESLVRFIETDAEGRSWVSYEENWQQVRHEVARRKKRVRRIRLEQGAAMPERLIATLSLPGFRHGDAPIFTPLPEFSRIVYGELPATALQRIGPPALAKERDTRPAQAEIFEEELLDESEAEEIDAALAAATGAM